MKRMRYKLSYSCRCYPFGDAPGRHWGTGGGGPAAERRERPDGGGYLIKPRDIQADLRRPRGHWMQRQLLAADRAGQHTIHRGGSPGQRGQRSAIGKQDQAHAMPLPDPRPVNVSAAGRSRLAHTPSFPVPSVSCQPLGRGCDRISTLTGGATSVKGLNAVDSASLATDPNGDIEPPDQGLCAGNGSVVETNNSARSWSSTPH